MVTVDQITFKEGQLVKPGDVLFVIVQRPYKNVLDQDKANLEKAEAQRQLKAANFARAQSCSKTKLPQKKNTIPALPKGTRPKPNLLKRRPR